MPASRSLDDFRFNLRGKELVPLICGGMGVDISTMELALEMARLGGVGHISDAMGPWVSDKRFGTNYQQVKLRENRHYLNDEEKLGLRWQDDVVYKASREHVERTLNQLRGPGLIFVNVMEKLSMGAPKESLRARLRGALDGGIHGVTLSAGLHTGTLALIEDNPRFLDVNLGIIVSSARALKIFLRSAHRVNRPPDYIIVEGPLAGGHLGFGPDWANYDLVTIVNDVLELLRAENLDIPVIPAGGIFTGTDAVRMLELGASAVQVATRFTISRECGLPDDVKQIYLRSSESDIEVNMSSPSGYPMRMLKSSPSLRSNIRPNCEALGYMLDGQGKCSYRDAYAAAPVDAKGRKLPVVDKMCICYHFMKYQCYTCGHNVYRLKDTTVLQSDGRYYLPRAAEVFEDYLTSTDGRVRVPTIRETECAQAA